MEVKTLATTITVRIDENEIKEDYITDTKNKLLKVLSNSNVSRLYKAFTNLELTHEEISYYIFNLFLEQRLKGYTFDEICELPNIDSFIKLNDTLKVKLGIGNDIDLCEELMRYTGVTVYNQLSFNRPIVFEVENKYEEPLTEIEGSVSGLTTISEFF